MVRCGAYNKAAVVDIMRQTMLRFLQHLVRGSRGTPLDGSHLHLRWLTGQSLLEAGSDVEPEPFPINQLLVLLSIASSIGSIITIICKPETEKSRRPDYQEEAQLELRLFELQYIEESRVK